MSRIMLGIIACDSERDEGSQGETYRKAGTYFYKSGKTLYRAAWNM
jgi:hypothetical protein